MKKNCNCKSKFQDKEHGKGVRVLTPVNKSRIQGKLTKGRCTVCGQEHTVQGE